MQRILRMFSTNASELKGKIDTSVAFTAGDEVQRHAKRVNEQADRNIEAHMSRPCIQLFNLYRDETEIYYTESMLRMVTLEGIAVGANGPQPGLLEYAWDRDKKLGAKLDVHENNFFTACVEHDKSSFRKRS